MSITETYNTFIHYIIIQYITHSYLTGFSEVKKKRIVHERPIASLQSVLEDCSPPDKPLVPSHEELLIDVEDEIMEP